MLTNKWFQLAMSVVMTLMGVLAAFDWTTVLSAKTAGVVVMVFGFIKMILNSISPAPGATVIPTGGAIVTHTTAGT
jgi:hypothetical protein